MLLNEKEERVTLGEAKEFVNLSQPQFGEVEDFTFRKLNLDMDSHIDDDINAIMSSSAENIILP